jgi:hypothetical protein
MTSILSNGEIVNIQVLLTDEPVRMWRPVKARQLKENIYQILSNQTVDEDEEWEFQPGDIVFVEEKLDFRGEVYLAAVKKVAF